MKVRVRVLRVGQSVGRVRAKVRVRLRIRLRVAPVFGRGGTNFF